MSKTQSPKKPEVSLSAASFTQNGKVYLEEEILPNTQAEADKWAVEHFIVALQENFNVSLKILSRIDEPADVVCITKSGKVIYIQVTEAVDLLNRALEETRASYKQALVSDHELMPCFNGCHLIFSDKGERPILPSLKSKNGVTALNELKSELREFSYELSNLEPGKVYLRKWNVGKDNAEVHLVCEYRASSEVPVSLSWSGARIVNKREDVFFIRKVIQQKIDKNYSKPQEEFWLLVYGANMPPINLDGDYEASKTLLSSSGNPFDKVWFLYPLVNSGGGMTRLIWER